MESTTLHKSLLFALNGKDAHVAFPQDATQVPLFNKDIEIVPAAIVKPETVQQVAAVVKSAAERGLKVQAKSGGHSYANHGFGGVDGSIVIDMGNFNQLTMDLKDYTATVGGGCLLGDLAQFLFNHGRAMPHGTWPGVGLGGHVTTGGMGPASRMWGLALDHVIGAEVVLADASIVKASETENPDLFFAIKGAAASFGIVTHFRLRTQPAPGECVEFQYTMGSPDTALRIEWFKTWQRFVSDLSLSRKLSVGLEIFPHKMVISGNYFRPKADFDTLNITEFLPPSGTYIETVHPTWIDIVNSWAEGIRVNYGGGASRSFYAKSLNFKRFQLVPEDVAERIFQNLAIAYASGAMMVISFHPAGGRVNDVDPDATAYPHRDTLFWMQFAAVRPGGLDVSTRDLVHGIDRILLKGMPQARFGAYLGHVDPDLANPSEAYWGINLPQLKRLKAKFDFQDIFHHPQSVSIGEKAPESVDNQQLKRSMPRRVDVHHHFLPPDVCFDFGTGPLQDFQVLASRLPKWSPQTSEDYMDMVGKDGTAILSFPLLYAFPDSKGVAIARQVNDYAARLRDKNPTRFGFFAALPSLWNVDAAIPEISRAFHELKADGIVLLARYGDSYLGDPSFEPIWAELNKHSAVVFIHPGTTFRSTIVNKYVDPAVAEFPHETTQTALDMIMNNTVRHNSNCKIILSHAGGTLPYLIGRASSIIPFFAAHVKPPPKTAAEIVEDAKLFYFDLALSSTPYVLDSLLRNFPKDRILCGSDYPFAPPPSTISLAQALDRYEMDDETREMIYWKNACAIMPRLRR